MKNLNKWKMETNFRSQMVEKYGEDEVKKAESDDFYMGVIPFAEVAMLDFRSWQNSQDDE